MRRPPPISQFIHYPVTGGIALLAIVVTIAYMNDHSIDKITMSYLAFHGEPWRLITSIFPHAGIIHILFNILWLWSFGTLIEERYGHLAMAGLCAVLAVGSSAAEYALGSGGIGLSGVVYGLWGFLWVLGRHDPRWRDGVDQQTSYLFIGWFFLCVVMTLADKWHIGNVAHGSGAILGAIIGFAVIRPVYRQRIAAGVLLLLLAATFWAATAGRPLVNDSKNGGDDFDRLGLQAFERNDNIAALHFYEMATSMRHTKARYWHNLGVAYSKLGNQAKAMEALARAQKMESEPAAAK